MRYLWLTIFFSTLIWSSIDPHDQLTWWLEVAPAMIGLLVMIITYRSFPLTPLVYVLILIHCLILMIGAHYTYALVPGFDQFEWLFDSTRNQYDKLGHLAQGLVPALVAREILIRKQVINGRYWLNFLVVCFCLAVSAVYELIEWIAALTSGEAAEAFLGTQGYIWDTQSDMACAFVGALLGLWLLSRLHDRQLQRLPQ
jgi:putative membrane protein